MGEVVLDFMPVSPEGCAVKLRVARFGGAWLPGLCSSLSTHLIMPRRKC